MVSVDQPVPGPTRDQNEAVERVRHFIDGYQDVMYHLDVVNRLHSIHTRDGERRPLFLTDLRAVMALLPARPSSCGIAMHHGPDCVGCRDVAHAILRPPVPPLPPPTPIDGRPRCKHCDLIIGWSGAANAYVSPTTGLTCTANPAGHTLANP